MAPDLERTNADNVTDILRILSQCAFVLIASWLVLVRPGVMTGAFYLYGVGWVFSLLCVFITSFAYVISMLGFRDTYRHATRENRQRIKWVIAGFAVGIAGLITGFAVSDVSLSALAIPAWVARAQTSSPSRSR